MRSLILFVFAAILLTGCTRVLDVNSPTEQARQEFLKLNIAAESGVEWTMGASKYIDGDKGGFVNFSKNYISESGRRISLNINLTIPKGAFTGKQVIGYTVNSETAAIDFQPSPMNFNIPLKLDYTISGVDLSKVNCSLVDFFYLDSNHYVQVQYDSKTIEQSTGTLSVTGALVWHFSRYGWGTIDSPDQPGATD